MIGSGKCDALNPAASLDESTGLQHCSKPLEGPAKFYPR